PFAARDRLIVVPTRAAAELLLRGIEERQLGRGAHQGSMPNAQCLSAEPEQGPGPKALILPDVVPTGELVSTLAQRLDQAPQVLGAAEREALLGASCRAVQAGGMEPPFRLRPGLLNEMLRFYDALTLNQRSVDVFERLALGVLEPGALDDRGAERLVRQTRFLAAAFREFEERCGAVGVDTNGLRRQLTEGPSRRPFRHVVLAVADRALDPHGLGPAEWDLLARIPGLERLDVVATDRTVAGEFHEAVHRLLPGIEEVRMDLDEPAALPVLCVPERDTPVHRPRDREEEVADFARRVKAGVRAGHIRSASSAALVVHQRLPYVYVAREVCRSAGLPCQMFDALPLAAEPFAAALDLVLSAVGSNFARVPAIALLRSPHLQLGATRRGSSPDVEALDRALAESSYLGDPAALRRLVDAWHAAAPQNSRVARVARVAQLLLGIADELAPLQESRPMDEHLRTLAGFLAAHDVVPGPDDPLRARQLRARGAIMTTLATLADAFERFDRAPVGFADVRALVRRWIDAQTFSPRAGESGVHVVDSASARFGDFDLVQLAGLVEGEWPEPPRRNIFYSTAILRELGWPAEKDRLQGARAAFADLVTLPGRRLVASSFLLEADALVGPSPLVDELSAVGLDGVEEPNPARRIFDHEALGAQPVRRDLLQGHAAQWAALRVDVPAGVGPAYRGSAGPHQPTALSLSAIERYVDCPFKFFAADVLRLEEPPEEDAAFSPKARGRFVHEALQRFFEAWDRSGQGPITAANLAQARAVFAQAVAPLLDKLPEADAALERTRLFGSAISSGVVETVLSLEASRRPEPVVERWLEYRLDGEFSLGGEGDSIPLRGVADRIDLLPGQRLRVIDYKSGNAPQGKLALQAPIYALCAQERLTSRDGVPWQVDEAAYLGLGGARSFVPIVRSGSDDDEALSNARTRVLGVVAAVRAGEFPPRPLDEMSCRRCAYASVCRKDYVGDE
ncbi:MAG TPA: PD-(D/E)XK nuclease family protein, partial [Vicinamibacterales bacterium]